MRRISLLLLSLTLVIASALFASGCGGCSSKSYSVVVTCTPENGGSVTGAGTYKKGKTYNLVAQPNEGFDFEGWYLNSVKISEETEYFGTIGANNIYFVAKFTAKTPTKPIVEQKKLTIKYVDDLGRKVSEDFSTTKNKGENYSVNVEKLVGYTADKTVVSGKLDTDTTVTVTYTRREYTLIINYVDGDDNVLTEKEEHTLKYGDNYTYNVVNKVSYYNSSVTTLSGVLSKDNSDLSNQLNNETINLYVVHTPKIFTINFLLIDEDRNVIDGVTMPSTTKSYLETFNFTPIDVTGYEKGSAVTGALILKDDLVGEQISDGRNELTITFQYASLEKPRNVSIKYLDTNGTNIKENSSVSKKVKEAYSIAIDDIEDYDIDSEKMTTLYGENFNLTNKTLSGTVPIDSNFEIIIYYKIKTVNLTINYLKAGDVSISQSYTTKVDYYGSYNVTSPVIKGYTTQDLVVSGTIAKEDVVKNIYYTVNNHTITINYLYENGTVASQQKVFNNVEYGSTFVQESPAIEGYTPIISTVSFTFIDDADKTINVTYTINSYYLTINYVSDVDGFVAPITYREKLQYNSNYSVVSPLLYGLIADKTTVSGKKLAENEVITVSYSLNDVLVIIDFVNNKGEMTGLNTLTEHFSFTDKNKTLNIGTLYRSDGYGYTSEYKSISLSILENGKKLSVVGVRTSDSQAIDLFDICKITPYHYYFKCWHVYIKIEAKQIESTVTVKYIYDGNKNNVLETKTFKGYYGDNVIISKDFGGGYIKDSSSTSFYTSDTYTYTDEDETIYVNYNRIEKTVSIQYVDADLSFKLSPTVTKKFKYGENFSITSPTIECYKADKSEVTGKMDLTDLNFIVKYSVQWAVDSDNALIINTPQYLVTFSKYPHLWQRDISITENLDLTGITLSPIGNYDNVFSGNVKGNGKTISNLKLTKDNVVINSKQINGINVSYAYVGLFGCFSGSIDSLTVTNAEIDINLGVSGKTNVYAGILVGMYSNSSSKGTINNVTVSGTITATAINNVIGGLIGFNSNTNSEISTCATTVTITSSTNTSNLLGGISGYEVQSNVHNCSSTLTTTLTESETTTIGGIVGESVNGVIHTNTANLDKACGKENGTIIY